MLPSLVLAVTSKSTGSVSDQRMKGEEGRGRRGGGQRKGREGEGRGGRGRERRGVGKMVGRGVDSKQKLR